MGYRPPDMSPRIGACGQLPNIHFDPSPREPPIAKNRNTYAKRQREQEKKQRANDKRGKREQRKVAVNQPESAEGNPESGPDDDAQRAE